MLLTSEWKLILNFNNNSDNEILVTVALTQNQEANFSLHRVHCETLIEK